MNRDFSLNTTADLALVPTLRVGMPSRTLCVLFRATGPYDRRRSASKTAFPRGARERERRYVKSIVVFSEKSQ
jgi:hypothetical protein